MDLEIGSTFGGDLRVLSRFDEVGLEDAFLAREGDDERAVIAIALVATLFWAFDR